MNNRCGLINKNNPCRCARKTTGFIKAGWVDKNKMKFNANYVASISEVVNEKNNNLNQLLESEYSDLFASMPFQEKEHSKRLIMNIFGDKKIRDTFNLN